MTLPSQSPRAAAIGRAIVRTHHRRGFRVPRLAVVSLIVLVCISAAVYFTWRKGGKTPSLSPDTAAAADLVPDPYKQNPKPPVREGSRTGSLLNRGSGAPPTAKPEETPVTISQGQTTPQTTPQTNPQANPAATLPAVELPKVSGDSSSSLGESLGRSQENPPAQQKPPASGLSRPVAAADQRLAANDPAAARSILSKALTDPSLAESDRSQLRARLTDLNQDLLFSSKVVKGDPMTDVHVIVSGDRLSNLPDRLGLAIDWRLLQRINGISDPNRIQLGQKIKIIRGPFHAVVHKGAYRLDIYAGPPEEEGAWTYIRSFRVGLGAPGDSPTPTGSFVVKRNSKLINPHWVNPKTGEKFDKDDPKNPIGERWIGLEGVGNDAVKTGYGIHGTIEPSSVGDQKSMGCVRMLDTDVELVYELLVEGISRVRIEE